MQKTEKSLPENVIERLSEYRQLLNVYQFATSPHITSSGLSRLLKTSQETIRRDFMLLGCKKSSLKYGYNVHEIIELIDNMLDTNQQIIPIALVGDCGSFINGFLVDYLGEKIKISAVFNLSTNDNLTIDKNVEVYSFTEINKVVVEKNIRIAVLNIPSDFAEQIADILVKSGIHAIINFSPKRLYLPPDVYLEEINLITKLEKAIYFSNKGKAEPI